MKIISNLKFWKGDKIKSMTGNNIFVFGSNPEGRHGLGAAKDAQNFGAKYWLGRGISGNTYALPTKNLPPHRYKPRSGNVIETIGPDVSNNPRRIEYTRVGPRSITLEQIRDNILDLYLFAERNPHLTFFIAYKASRDNLNGYSANEIFTLFVDDIVVPDNIRFHNSFRNLICNQ
jgi:hypothetical protein